MFLFVKQFLCFFNVNFKFIKLVRNTTNDFLDFFKQKGKWVFPKIINKTTHRAGALPTALRSKLKPKRTQCNFLKCIFLSKYLKKVILILFMSTDLMGHIRRGMHSGDVCTSRGECSRREAYSERFPSRSRLRPA